jgi:hypothetical protein
MKNNDLPQTPSLPQKNVMCKFSVHWTPTISSEVTEDFINKMSNEQFRIFIECKLPKKYLRTMRDNFLNIGEEKRLLLLNKIKLSNSLGRF